MVRLCPILAGMKECIPHAPWGWSDFWRWVCSWARVFPTPVGMVRDGVLSRNGWERIPHARGDGPATTFSGWSGIKYSPRPWGWSGTRTPDENELPVSPHARGDGPPSVQNLPAQVVVSPHARGDGPGIGAPVTGPRDQVSPHARGDGPAPTGDSQLASLSISPRPWGWSVFTVLRGLYGGVSPHARGDGPASLNAA